MSNKETQEVLSEEQLNEQLEARKRAKLEAFNQELEALKLAHGVVLIPVVLVHPVKGIQGGIEAELQS